MLRIACEVNRVDFLYPIESFRRFTHDTGKFPLGFANSVPDAGHFNQDGHRLIAESVVEYLRRHGYPSR